MGTANQPDPLDSLLANLENDFNTSKAMQDPGNTSDLDRALQDLQQRSIPAPPPPSSSPPQSSATDAMLTDFVAEFQSKPQPTPQSSGTADIGLDDLAQSFVQRQTQASTVAASQAGCEVESGLDALAAQFKAKPKPAKPSAPALDRTLENQARQAQQQRDQAWYAQQRRMRLEKKAHEWLEQLDPYSNEGIWFQDFAKHYPSQLAAAIDYLESLLAQKMAR